VFLRRTGELVGFLDVKPISRYPHKMADVGYFVINSYRGRGYAKEALRRLIFSVFKDLDLHRLEAVIDLDNKTSIAVAKSSGLYRECIRKHFWFQNGRWEDQVVFIATPELFH
jgi:RimJ/RimL family protein N-acetyltransferase